MNKGEPKAHIMRKSIIIIVMMMMMMMMMMNNKEVMELLCRALYQSTYQDVI